MEGIIENQISPSGILPEVDPVRSFFEIDCWFDNANVAQTDGHQAGAPVVPAGYKVYIYSVVIDNSANISIIDIYDAAAAAGAEANWVFSAHAPANDTTQIESEKPLFILATGAAIDASVCAVDHDVKIKLSGLKVKA